MAQEPEPRPDVSGSTEWLGSHILAGPGCQAKSLDGVTGPQAFAGGEDGGRV